MSHITEDDVIKIIAGAFESPGVKISRESDSKNTDDWDSLIQINIIVALNDAFDGKVGSIQAMASADSVEEILQILKNNQLI